MTHDHPRCDLSPCSAPPNVSCSLSLASACSSASLQNTRLPSASTSPRDQPTLTRDRPLRVSPTRQGCAPPGNVDRAGASRGPAPPGTPSYQVSGRLLVRAAGSRFARVALLLVLKRKLLEARCCPPSLWAGPRLPWVLHKGMCSHGPLAEWQAGSSRAVRPESPRERCVLEGETPPHSSEATDSWQNKGSQQAPWRGGSSDRNAVFAGET